MFKKLNHKNRRKKDPKKNVNKHMIVILDLNKTMKKIKIQEKRNTVFTR